LAIFDALNKIILEYKKKYMQNNLKEKREQDSMNNPEIRTINFGFQK
jgi:hypothetical protein